MTINALYSLHKKTILLVAFLCFFFCFFWVIESINGRLWTNDYKVYFSATKDFFSGKSPYINPYGLGSGYFKYPPYTLYLFSPNYFLSFKTGQFIHLFISLVSLIGSFLIIWKIKDSFYYESKNKLSIGWMYFAFLSIAIHLSRELHLGNINLILLFLFCLGVYTLLNKKEFSSALFFSLMIILKPILILVIIPLLVYRKWKILIIISLFGLVFILFPMVHLGFNGNLTLFKEWLLSLKQHNNSLTSFNSINSIVNNFMHTSYIWFASYFTLLILTLIMFFKRQKNNRSETDLIQWTCVFSAFVPNFFITDTEHFLLSFPLIVLLLVRIINIRNPYYWMIFLIGMILYSFNSNDLLGSKLSTFVYDNGLLGLGNLVFISLFLLTNQLKTHIQKPIILS